MSTFSQSLQQEPDVHPGPCWFPYYDRCTCFDEPPAPKVAQGSTDSQAGAR